MMITDFDIQMVWRLLLAALLGSFVGLEREIHGRPAGFRTHLLVSLGSALFVVVSIEFYRSFGNFKGPSPIGVDPARVAAQVVTGIGFLGAGAIIKEKATVRGLTTAACLWLTAAVGVSCGVGLFTLSIAVTAIALASLIILKKAEGKLTKDTYATLTVTSDNIEGQIDRIAEAITGFGLSPTLVRMERKNASGILMYEFQVKMRGQEIAVNALEKVSGISGIREVSIGVSAVNSC